MNYEIETSSESKDSISEDSISEDSISDSKKTCLEETEISVIDNYNNSISKRQVSDYSDFLDQINKINPIIVSIDGRINISQIFDLEVFSPMLLMKYDSKRIQQRPSEALSKLSECFFSLLDSFSAFAFEDVEESAVIFAGFIEENMDFALVKFEKEIIKLFFIDFVKTKISSFAKSQKWGFIIKKTMSLDKICFYAGICLTTIDKLSNTKDAVQDLLEVEDATKKVVGKKYIIEVSDFLKYVYGMLFILSFVANNSEIISINFVEEYVNQALQRFNIKVSEESRLKIIEGIKQKVQTFVSSFEDMKVNTKTILDYISQILKMTVEKQSAVKGILFAVSGFDAMGSMLIKAKRAKEGFLSLFYSGKEKDKTYHDILLIQHRCANKGMERYEVDYSEILNLATSLMEKYIKS